jgi:hypothetical protein
MAGLAALTLLAPACVGAEAPDARWLRFAVHFEPGDRGLPRVDGDAFGPGRVNSALRLGADTGVGAPGFRAVVDLTRPGAITCWVRPRNWVSVSSEYVPVLRLLGNEGAVMLVERDRRPPRRSRDVWIAGFFSVADRGNVILRAELPGKWSADSWHLLALQWDATGFSLHVDNGPEVRAAAPVAQLARRFPTETSTLAVGGGSREGLWVDELSVWSRMLGASEIAAVSER